jgi:8-oxo-dGTP diphosphatase
MAKEGEEHFVAKIAQKVIIEKDGKVLIVRHPNSDKWEIPGGRLNKGELPEDGVKREVLEEIGAEIQLRGLVHANTFVHEIEGDHLTLYYSATLANPDNEFVLEKAEIAEVKWIDQTQYEEQALWPDIQEAIEIFFKQK